jgi:hypothetical protein
MQLLFTPDDAGTTRATGYATVDYSSNAENETVVETTEDDLSGIFQAAADGGVTDLAGTGEPIAAGVENPLAHRDFLVLEGGEIVFDTGYSREDK